MTGVSIRTALAWVGVAFFGVIAVLATIHLAGDVFEVVTHIASLAALGPIFIASVVILGGAAWLIAVTWLAGRGRRGEIIAVAAGIGVLIVVRIAVAIAYDGVVDGEPRVYHQMARDLADGVAVLGADPIDRPIGYPLLLAGAYVIAGQTALAVESLNLLLALLAGVAVFALGRGLYGVRVGAVALTLYALWPAGALMVAARLPQTAHDLAIVAAAWALVAMPPGWRGSLLLGALLGLSHYLRPITLALLPAFLLARIWPGAPWREALRGSAIPMIVAFLVVLIPIMGWNLATRGVPDISTSAHGGWSLYVGTDVENGGRFNAEATDEMDALSGGDPWERSRIGYQRSFQRIADDPVGIALLAVRKQYDLWGAETDGVRYGIRRDLADRPYRPNSVMPSLASGTFYVVLLIAGTAGLYLRRRELDALSVLLILTALTVSVMHGLVEVRDRYHSYVIPLLMPIAAFAIVALYERATRSRRERQGEKGEAVDTAAQ